MPSWVAAADEPLLWLPDIVAGAYWLVEPRDGAELAIVCCGAITPEAIQSLRAEGFAGAITLIASAQQVEHHEIAVYGTLRSWAELLGQDGAANTIESILEEEKKADKILSEISDTVNTTAEPRTAYTR